MTQTVNTKSADTKSFVEIAEIRESVLILKNGSLRSLVEVNSTNFELKSADEQIATIRAFQNFLNSTDFPIQIVVSSRKLDIGPYLKSLNEVIEQQTNELLKIQAVEYSRFVRGLTELANIMSKKFYIVVPFYVLETPATKAGFFSALKSIFSPSKFVRALNDSELEVYKTQLAQRIDVVTDGVSGMGLEARLLNQEELTNLFYQYYNPGHQLTVAAN